jgi:hypothetical protein
MKMKKVIFLGLILLLLPSISFGQVSQNCLDLNVNLKQGQRDSANKGDIVLLQNFLKNTGYLNTNSTGFFGVQTLKAVKVFQKANNINPTGFVGPQTRSTIKNSSCVVTIEAVTPPEIIVPEITIPTPTQPVTPTVIDEVISSGSVSSLRVRTSGVVSIYNDSVVLMGQVTAGARSGTVSFFETTTNPLVYKTSETIISSKSSQKSNDKFQISINGLKPETNYYFRACAENISLGQKSCGGTSTLLTNK